MSSQGFMKVGASPAAAQKRLSDGQMRVGSMRGRNNQSNIEAKERKLEELENLEKKGRKVEEKKEKKSMEDRTFSEEVNKNLDEGNLEGINLEAVNVFKLKSIAQKKGYKGEKFDKKSLIEFLSQPSNL